jgi:hypothetical protein
LVVFISLALSNVSFLVSNTVAGPPLRLEGMREGAGKNRKENDSGDNE